MLENSKGILNDTLDASNLTVIEMVGECFFNVPLSIVRSGVLRQGFANFYSLSFQAILSLFFCS
jgi:hypothetical protein